LKKIDMKEEHFWSQLFTIGARQSFHRIKCW
jgi:hypothetical protein